MTNEELVQLLEPVKFKLNEKKFKTQFIANFLSTWVVNNYDNACARGEHERLNKPPVEDAEFLANEAWSYWLEINGKVK